MALVPTACPPGRVRAIFLNFRCFLPDMPILAPVAEDWRGTSMVVMPGGGYKFLSLVRACSVLPPSLPSLPSRPRALCTGEGVA